MTGDQRIPRVFHFVFGLREQNEPFHLLYYLCLRSCIEVNRPTAVHFHYLHEPHGEWWDRIRPHLVLRRVVPDETISAYRYADPALARYRYAHLADVTRLQILWEEGGIYADIDTLFLKPLPPEWLSHAFILGREKVPSGTDQDGSLCNAWIASAPRAPFCRRWLDGIIPAFDGSWSNHSTLLPYRLACRYPDEIFVQPERAFYALDWTPAGIADLFTRSVWLPEDARSLHLWNHLWFATVRRDFSDFHGGLLTPDYVAFADTTYARHARRFLPINFRASRLAWTRQRLSVRLERAVRKRLAQLRRMRRATGRRS